MSGKKTIQSALKKLNQRRAAEVGVAVLVLIIVGFLGFMISPYSKTPTLGFYEGEAATSETVRATVEEISGRTVQARIQDGPSEGMLVEITYEETIEEQAFNKGAVVLLNSNNDSHSFMVIDQYRLPIMALLVAVFVAVVLIVGRRKGLKSLIGLFASIFVIAFLLIPLVKTGFDTFFACVIVAAIIAVITILVSQGFTKKAYAILIAMGSVLVLVAVSAWLVTMLMGLTGMVDDATYYISMLDSNIHVAGLVTGGIVIAAVGALDDIVTTQIAAVEELRHTNKKLTDSQVFAKGSRIGAEHISSLVNTLAMVYVGAALPLIVIYSITTADTMHLLNSQLIATEVARTMIISIGLVLAVPLSTWLGVVMSRRVTSRPSRG